MKTDKYARLISICENAEVCLDDAVKTVLEYGEPFDMSVKTIEDVINIKFKLKNVINLLKENI